ncbi:GNAT family N-acetyltransferase [Limnoraphis robusta Tam1]|uniref:GNAT family N-acetyltransferase n=1 Tax=Limnoraphis robusta TaxID=1118279 RepID=UPI002B200E3C|nr:GNAT family N-acetyltransferase [Limnoraphis robusta]MEA5542944.1 GNAT family N-acetyltransferase [Limnoraphis robusta Tam1]
MSILFQTDRLIIRNWEPEQDASQAFEIYGDPEVMYFISPPLETVEMVRSRLQERVEQDNIRKNGTGSWAVIDKETEEIVGAILLVSLPDNDGIPTTNYEIGWHFRKASWGKGYATEAAQKILGYGFTILRLPVIYAVVKPENRRSIRVTQRLGMKPLGLTNEYYGVELSLFKLEDTDYYEQKKSIASRN